MVGSVGGPRDKALGMTAGGANCVPHVRPLHTDPGPTDPGALEAKVGAVPPTIVWESMCRLRTSTLRRVRRLRVKGDSHS